MGRALVYVLLLGAITGAVAGVAVFGLPLPGEGAEGELPAGLGALAEPLLARGLSLAGAAVLLGAAVLVTLLVAAVVDLRRRARRRA